jgi:hypothetical protein
MKTEFEKTMLISSELLSYCHLMGADQFHLDVKIEEGETLFEIKASPAELSKDELEALIKDIGAPRRIEIEQDYWGLSGESESSSELMLVGMMSDETSVEYRDGELLITIHRRH